MKTLHTTTLVWLAALCVAPVCHAETRYYLDPSYGIVRYEDLSRPSQPLLLKIAVTETWNGKPFEMIPGQRRTHAVHVLRKSGLIRSSYGGEDGRLALIIETLNKEKIFTERKGPGRVEQIVLSLDITLSANGRILTRQFEHAFLIYSGSAQDPPGLTPILGRVGWGQVRDAAVEQLLLRAMRDFQSEGMIPTGDVTPQAPAAERARP